MNMKPTTPQQQIPMEEENVQIVSGITLAKKNVKLKPSHNKIIKASEFERDDDHVQIVGGDGEDLCGAEGTPAIIIERQGDVISKIIVRCPCGRHSELVCEYQNE